MTVPLEEVANGADAPADLYVVRAPGEWTIAPVPVADPVVVDVADVIGLVGTAARTGAVRSPRRVRAPTPVGPHDRVEPVWMYVLLVAEGGLVATGPGGEHVRLDADDVRLIDVLNEAVVVADLVVEGVDEGIEARCDRLGRLVAAGCVRVVERGEAPRPDPPAGGSVLRRLVNRRARPPR